MANFGSLTAETGWRVWTPQQISTGFASWLRYCTDVAQRRSTKLCTMFGRLLGWYIIHCDRDGFEDSMYKAKASGLQGQGQGERQ